MNSGDVPHLEIESIGKSIIGKMTREPTKFSLLYFNNIKGKQSFNVHFLSFFPVFFSLLQNLIQSQKYKIENIIS